MKKRISRTLFATFCIVSMPPIANADTLNATDEFATIQSIDSLLAENPTDQTLYKHLGQIYQQENSTSIHTFVNGKTLAFDTPPFISDGRTLTPIRAISEALGFSVNWNPNTQQVTISNNQNSIQLTISTDQAEVNGAPVTLDVPATIVSGRTFVPLRFVSESLGANVNWYPNGEIIAITNSLNSISNIIQAPIISQKPELYNGCEVTSTTMLLQWAGVAITKLEAADVLTKDPTPVKKDTSGNITFWGNPNTGFVGDVTGATMGYAVYHTPIVNLINCYLPGKAVDLTGQNFDQIIGYVKSGKPVVVWNTSFFHPTNDWVTWNSPEGPVKATFDEHCVLLVGADTMNGIVYINDPLDGTKAKAVPLQGFEEAWEQLGSQAVSVK